MYCLHQLASFNFWSLSDLGVIPPSVCFQKCLCFPAKNCLISGDAKPIMVMYRLPSSPSTSTGTVPWSPQKSPSGHVWLSVVLYGVITIEHRVYMHTLRFSSFFKVFWVSGYIYKLLWTTPGSKSPRPPPALRSLLPGSWDDYTPN